jgi:long-chain acyl-CoA synthetase
MREYSTPAVVEIPASARLTDTIFERAEHDPEAVILRRKTSPAPARNRHGQRGADRGTAWRDVTAREFRDEVAELARGFIAAGIGEGDRVGLLSRTRYEWTVIDYALWAAGAVTVRYTRPPPPSRWNGYWPTRARGRSWSRPSGT